MKPLNRVLIAVLLGSAALAPACSEDQPEATDTLNAGPDVTRTTEMAIEEADIIGSREGDQLIFRLPITRLVDREIDVTVEAAVRTLERDLVGRVERETTLTGAENEVVVTIDGADTEIGTGDLADYVLHYRVYTRSNVLFGRRSVYDVVEKRAIHLVSSDAFYDGLQTHVRIVATEPVTGRPLSEANVQVYLISEDAEELMYTGQTDEFGVLSAPVQADEEQVGSQELRVVVDSELGSETIERPVQVRRDDRVLVTTDKPLYQPGQTIHIRTLSLRRGDLAPAANEPILIEVMDGKGNKIMKEAIETDDFGVAATSLLLARELNMGEFLIRATLRESTTERTVTIDRYRLPRYTVALTTDGSFFRPGQTAPVLVDAQYLFGEPVANALLTARVWQHDMNDRQLTQIDAMLDASGMYTFDVDIPEFFSSEPLRTGEAHVRVDVTVVDGAGEERDASLVLAVTERDLLISVFPAHNLVPNRDNAFHVIVTDPTGVPLALDDCTGSIGDVAQAFETDTRGTDTLTFAVGEVESLTVTVSCDAPSGEEVSGSFTFSTGDADRGAIAVISDKSLYESGSSAMVTVIGTPGIERVFIDLIANNRAIWTDELVLDEGAATTEIDLPIDLAGSVEISAYHLGIGESLLVGKRVVYVEAANDLQISFAADQDEYLPGEDAHVDVTITDADGNGVAAALGLAIVDEAVFALQDMRPGAERIFFQLEQEVIEPLFDTCGFDIGDVVDQEQNDQQQRERAAEIFFAASAGSPGYGIVVDTYSEMLQVAVQIVSGQLQTDATTVVDETARMIERLYGDDYDSRVANVERHIEGLNGEYFDPWGQPYLFEAEFLYGGDAPDVFNMTGSGPDEILGTPDDVTQQVWTDLIIYNYNSGTANGGDRGGVVDAEEGDAMFDGPMAGAGGGGEAPPADPDSDGTSDDGGSGGDAPRVRSFFPETLLVEPALITDGDGTASLDFAVADSITTWRLTGMANTVEGQLGSSTAGLRVFQPFFVDIDFPPTLTQNDEVSVPVAVFNFLDEPQDVTIDVTAPSEPWYELLADSSQTISLGAGEVTSVPFRVRVDKVGTFAFEVSGTGGDFPDAVRRTVMVLPDGEEHVVAVSDRLEEDVELDISIPSDAIDGGTGVFVKVYPGMFSQVVEGLDSLLRMPSGCFEQTSSSTYPTVLALRYMRETGQVTPEIEERALTFISTGYQRLLSFEVNGGGFEWFGNDPAHRILTAYGLLEFSDMADVYEIDPAVITRTQNWLAAQQEADGRFKAAPEGIHEGATNNFQDSDVRATAYITYALVESGFEGNAADRAVAFVKSEMSTVEDTYTLALIANMLISHDRNDADITSVLSRLANSAEEDGEAIFWSSDSQSLTYGSGSGMAMETTALALYAFIRAGSHPDLVDGGITYLVRNKDSFGTWSSTQATILSLRTFIALLENSAEPADATVTVSVDGDLIQTIEVDESNFDVVRQVDISHLAALGDTPVAIGFEGTGSLLYQVVTRYYTPWPDVVDPPVLALSVDYPEDAIGVGEAASVDVEVTNHLEGRAEMVMLHVGVPPGFDVDMRTLTEHVGTLFSRADRAGDGVDIYLYGLDASETLTFDFDIVPRFPMAVQTPPSEAYLYYEPDVRGESQPAQVVVQ